MRLIDADELIKDIDYSADMGGALGKVVECVKYYAKYMVASAPTTEERKKGKWLVDGTFIDRHGNTIEVQRCSNCRFKHYYCQGVTELEDDTWFNYCPNCGSYNGEQP